MAAEPARPYWEHVVRDSGHYLRMVGANGEPMLTSEAYTRGEEVTEAYRSMIYSVAGVTAGIDQLRYRDERTR